jgi:hypothetical protein
MAEDSKPPQIALADAIHLLQTFRGADLPRTTSGPKAQKFSALRV